MGEAPGVVVEVEGVVVVEEEEVAEALVQVEGGDVEDLVQEEVEGLARAEEDEDLAQEEAVVDSDRGHEENVSVI